MLFKGACRLVSIALAVTSFAAASVWSAEFEAVFGVVPHPDADTFRRGPGAVGTTPLPPLPALEAEEPDLVRSRDAAYRVADHYDPADYFVEDLHRSLDFDPHAAFEYVRDRIALDPYAGVLRGHEGVLGARAGNALERALLLERLLEDMAYDARLVFGVADASTADALLRHALTWRGQRSAPEPLSAVIGLIPPVMERMLQRAKRDHAWLLPVAQDVLQAASPARISAGNDRVHYWVQVRLDGQWLDLDTAFPEAQPGDAFVKPAGYGSDASLEKAHVVEIRVVGERLRNDSLQESTLLEIALDAHEAAQQRIYLMFQPTDQSQGGTLARALGEGRTFKPVLSIDGDLTNGRAAAPLVVGNERSDAAEFLGAGAAAGLSGLYLDVTVASPEQSPRTRRRVLLDRVPAAKRAQGSLTAADLQPVAVVEDTPEAFAAIHQITVSNGGTNPHKTANGLGLAVDYLATYLTGDGVLERIDVDALFWPLAAQRAAIIAANERLVTRALDGLTGARFFIGTPRIYVFSKGAVATAEGPPDIATQVDLLDDDVSVVAAREVSAQALAARRMWYGVFQSAFETTLLELPYMAIGEQPGGLVSASTRVDGNAVLADGSLASADDEQISFALKRALEGPAQVVIADSQHHSPDTWWTIAPDGMVRAMLAPGLGGVSDHTWWKNYTNSSFPTKTYRTSMSPDATHAQRQAYLDGTRKAYRSGGGQAAAAKAQRAKKGPSTPARRAGASRGGHLEDSLMRTAMLMTLKEPITAVTLTVVAGATVSFLAMFVYAAFI